MLDAFYSQSIKTFIDSDPEYILGKLVGNSGFSDVLDQKSAWKEQIILLKKQLVGVSGRIYFEFTIPRMGKRVDVLLLVGGTILILEFKVGEKEYLSSAFDQVWDYALDLKSFHETSHHRKIVPILVATGANRRFFSFETTNHDDEVFRPITISGGQIGEVVQEAIKVLGGNGEGDKHWEAGSYKPTPTIIEAAVAMYSKHRVESIIRRDASAKNLAATTSTLIEIIHRAKGAKKKVICFVTGVPGAGKTLVGLDVATRNNDKKNEEFSVYLSGNGPLVSVLQEALSRDLVAREKAEKRSIKKGEAHRRVKMFIQNVHHFRDACLKDGKKPPFEHVAIFDEAQRAWNREMTSDFMNRKKNVPGFDMSESEFLISCLDRHKDWAVIVCLVGGGQEINRGEAGISEWFESIQRSFPDWGVCYSPELVGKEYVGAKELSKLAKKKDAREEKNLHLSVSLRSFRAKEVSSMVNAIIDLDRTAAASHYKKISPKYPIVLTRNVGVAREWLRKMARGTQRYGIVVSSSAERLKPHAIDVRAKVNPIHWFLSEKSDVRSSYFLEDVATEFQVQGLELDWSCVTWDADLRFSDAGWEHMNFVGKKWNQVKKVERKRYLENAYRVLLTRARQGMVIVVPEGDKNDKTRNPSFYNPTFNFLKSLGFPVI